MVMTTNEAHAPSYQNIITKMYWSSNITIISKLNVIANLYIKMSEMSSLHNPYKTMIFNPWPSDMEIYPCTHII